MTDTAVLVSCHGTVSRSEDIPAFLNNVRRGRPTPPELVAEVTHRFELFGGSPLMKITEAQARALSARLGLPVAVSGRLWHPYPQEVIPALVDSGVRTIVSLPLAPQSVDIYHAPVREAAAAFPGLTIREVPAYGLEPALIDAFVETIEEALAKAPADARGSLPIVLSAHSLPRRVIAAGDQYEKQFREMAGAVADKLISNGHGNPVSIAFQSQGASAEPWLGPDLAEAFGALAKAGARGVLVAPIGFLSEHVETLYDLDIEAPKIAEKAGLSLFVRAGALCDRPRFIDALEAIVRRALAR